MADRDAIFNPAPDSESRTQRTDDNVIRGRFPDKLPEAEQEFTIKPKHVIAAGAVALGAYLIGEILGRKA